MSEENINRLLTNRHFAAYAEGEFRRYGISPPQDPAREYLLALRGANPQAFGRLVASATAEYEAEYEAAHEARVTALEKVNARLPAATVAAVWNALPKTAAVRRGASDPRLEADAKRLGITPLPGLSAGESMVAYLHAASKDAHLRTDEGLADLAKATGNAFGDARTLRTGLAKLSSWHETDTVADKIGATQRESEKAMDRARGIKRETPPSSPQDPHHAGTRDEVKRQFDQRPAVAQRVLVKTRKEFENLQHRNKHLAPRYRKEVEFTPELKHEFVQEARDDAYVHEQSQATSNRPAGNGETTT